MSKIDIKEIYRYLKEFKEANGYIPRLKTIAKEFGCTDCWISRRLDKLEIDGYISRPDGTIRSTQLLKEIE